MTYRDGRDRRATEGTNSTWGWVAGALGAIILVAAIIWAYTDGISAANKVPDLRPYHYAFLDNDELVENPTTLKCSIVTQKPTTTTETVVGNTVYKTRQEAESGMKTVKVCTDSTTGSGSSTTTIK